MAGLCYQWKSVDGWLWHTSYVPAVPSRSCCALGRTPFRHPSRPWSPRRDSRATTQPTPCGPSPAACGQTPDADLSSPLCPAAARCQTTHTSNPTSQGCYTLTPSIESFNPHMILFVSTLPFLQYITFYRTAYRTQKNGEKLKSVPFSLAWRYIVVCIFCDFFLLSWY